MRGLQFKSTPLQCPYRLSFERNQIPSFDPTKESLLPDPIDFTVPENAGRQEFNEFDMDSDEKDDVSLSHLLKHEVFGKNTQPESGFPSASNAVPSGQSVSLSNTSQIDVPASNKPYHSGDNFSQGSDNVDQESNPAHVEPKSFSTSDNRAHEQSTKVHEPNQEDEVGRDIPDPVTDVGEERPKKKTKKASAHPKVITTKIGCRKVPF